MIMFNATVTKKEPLPRRASQRPPAAASAQAQELSKPIPKPAPSVPAPPRHPVSPPQKKIKAINEAAFYQFPRMEMIRINPVPAPPAPPVKQLVPTPQMRTYAALKTAQMQHEQILSRIRGK